MSVCIAALFKDSFIQINEWIKYHLLFGVDHFFLCLDVCSPIDQEIAHRVLKRHIERDTVTLYNARELFPDTVGKSHASRQQSYYKYVLAQLKGSKQFDWLACVDVDEFIVPLAHKTIPSFLAKFYYKDVTGIVLRQMTLGCGNTDAIPTFTPASVIRTCHHYLYNPAAMKCISFVQNVECIDLHCIHGCRPVVNPTGVPFTSAETDANYNVAFYAHYVQPSLEALSDTFNNAYFPYNDYDPERRKSRCDIAMNRFKNNEWINYPETNKFDPDRTTNIVEELYEKRKAKFSIY
jgi:hypothetical protein